MSEPQHTPGPWHAEGPDMFGDFNICHPADSLAVAGVVANLRLPDEVAANARLVAAAPDMLAALQELSKLSDGIIVSGMSQSEMTALAAAWERADAAIAKATGAAS
jgi:glutamate/tyrosine decarboxylase-like PLP-dependent enzyme